MDMVCSFGIGIFLGVWSLIYLLHLCFKAVSLRYVTFLRSSGVQLQWHTSGCSGLASRCLDGPRARRIAHLWFSLGVHLTILTVFGVLFLLSRTLFAELSPLWTYGLFSDQSRTDHSHSPEAKADEYQGLVPVIPGFNVPFSQLPIFIAVLIIAGIIHELGHALAAASENVPVNGFGVFIIAVYPGAFTELDSEAMDGQTTFKKLKIYCGGIANNLALAFLGVGLLTAAPKLFSPLYASNQGVLVTGVGPDSGVDGPGGLQPGSSIVTGINYCRVSDEDTWHQCMLHLKRNNYGHCVRRLDLLAAAAKFGVAAPEVENVGGEIQCCAPNVSSSHLCFYHRTSSSNINQRSIPVVKMETSKLLQLPSSLYNNVTTMNINSSAMGYVTKTTTAKLEMNFFDYVCMPARYVTDHYICNSTLTCPFHAECLYAALFNNTKLLRFKLANQNKPVLFVGSPANVVHHVTVSNYVPRFDWLLLFASFPPIFELFCKYLVTFSLALALLNAVPCYSLDGQFIAAAVVEAFSNHLNIRHEISTALYKFLMFYGTTVLVLNIALALIRLLL